MATFALQVGISVALQLIANALRPDVKNEGPRLDDLSASTTQPGQPMPRPIGATISPGTVIYMTDLVETKTSKKSGGKGGPSVTNNEYSYSCSVAFAFSGHEVDGVARIKADQKTLWDESGSTDNSPAEIAALKAARYSEVYDAQIAGGATVALAEAAAQSEADRYEEELEGQSASSSPRYESIEIFLGTEDQEPSSILEALEGVGNVPAFRRTGYVVVKGLQLADFGNRLPVFQVITAGEVSASLPENPLFVIPTSSNWPDPGNYGLNEDTAGVDLFGIGYNVDGCAHAVISALMSYMAAYRAAGRGSENVTLHFCTNIGAPNNAWTPASVQSAAVTRGYNRVYEVECTPDDFTASSYGSLVFPYPNFDTNPLETDVLDTWEELKRKRDVDGADFGAVIWLGNSYKNQWQRTYSEGGGEPINLFEFNEQITDITDEFKAAGIYIQAVDCGSQSGSSLSLFTVDDAPQFSGDTGNGWRPDYNSTDGFVEVMHQTDWSQDDTRVWYWGKQADLQPGVGAGFNTIWWNGSADDPAGEAAIDDLFSGEVELHPDYYIDYGLADYMVATLFSGASAGFTSIGAIIRRFMTEWTPDISPFVEGDHFTIDPALDAMGEAGANFTRLTSPRQVAEECMKWRPISFFETGDKIKFVPRDGPAVATIQNAHLRTRPYGEDPGAALTTTREDDIGLPREIHVGFIDQNRTYSKNTAYARILRSRSSEVVAIDAVFTGTPADGARAAFMLIGEGFASRRKMTGALPVQYFILENADKVTLPENNGDTIEARIIKLEMGADKTIRCEFQDHVDAGDLVIDAETGVVTPPTTGGATGSILYVIDTARLTDDPELDDGFQLLIGVGGRSAAWAGATLYVDRLSGSSDVVFGEDYGDGETNFEVEASFNRSLAGGKLAEGLSAAVDEYVLDEISAMTVVFDTYAPEFATLSDAVFDTSTDNFFAVGNNVKGWEIIQAQNVVEVSEQIFTFSKLRRGVRGTEWAIPIHDAGDIVVHLDPTAMIRFAIDPAQMPDNAASPPAPGETIDMKAVSVGQDITTAATVSTVIVGRQSIMYAPSVGQVYRDASLDITAEVAGRALQADAGDLYNLPVAEQDFDVVIYSASQAASPAPTLLRTIELRDTSALSYTAAEQVTDFGSEQAIVYALIYQLSPAGVRGYAREVVL